MPTEDRRVGKLLPSPVTPATTVCYTIQIPNAVQYRAAFLGQLNVLGLALTWDHPRDGTECPDCEEAAQLWRNALYNATFSDECEVPMSCEDVADCIENDPVVKDKIQAIINQTSQPAVIAQPGVPMTPAQSSAALNPMETCDHDVLWAQCAQLVEYFTTAGTDTLEAIEAYSNAIEAGQFAEMIPVIGTLIDESQIDVAIDFVNWTQEALGEAYAAALTSPVKEAIACAIFCACKDDCEITIDRIWNVINVRLGGVLNPGDIDSLEDVATAVITLGTSPSLPVDVWLAFLTGGAKFAGYLGLRGIDQTLMIVLKLAVNDASNDWELLCLDCPTTEFCRFQDTTSSIANMVLTYTDAGYPYQTTFESGVGILGDRGGFVDENIPKIVLPASRTITGFSFDINITGSTLNVLAFMFIDGTFVDSQPVVSGAQTITFEMGAIPAEYIMFGVDRASLDRTQIGAITAWQILGEGSNPFGSDNC